MGRDDIFRSHDTLYRLKPEVSRFFKLSWMYSIRNIRRDGQADKSG